MATNKNTSKNTAKNTAKGDKTMATKSNEKKAQKTDPKKFAELANIRVPKALRILKSISTLSDKERYEYTDEQTVAILTALKNAVDEVAQCFANGGKKDEETFHI